MSHELSENLKPDPRRRLQFPSIKTRGLAVETAVAGILVAMKETGKDAYIYTGDFVRLLVAEQKGGAE